MTNTVLQGLLAGLVVILAAIVGYSMVPAVQPHNAFGSVAVSNEYQATTTATSNVYGTTNTADFVIRGDNTLGSIVVLGVTYGGLTLYDATTTNASLRDPLKSTSTLIRASIPTGMAAGTYTFDTATFKDGIYVDVVGFMPTTTITYRRN